MESPRFTVLSTPPASADGAGKGSAARKINDMVTMFSSPIPLEMIASVLLEDHSPVLAECHRQGDQKRYDRRHGIEIPDRIPAPRNITEHADRQQRPRIPLFLSLIFSSVKY